MSSVRKDGLIFVYLLAVTLCSLTLFTLFTYCVYACGFFLFFFLSFLCGFFFSHIYKEGYTDKSKDIFSTPVRNSVG